MFAFGQFPNFMFCRVIHNNYLTLSQTTNFRFFRLEEFTGDNFKFDENGRKFSKRIENTV